MLESIKIGLWSSGRRSRGLMSPDLPVLLSGTAAVAQVRVEQHYCLCPKLNISKEQVMLSMDGFIPYCTDVF